MRAPALLLLLLAAASPPPPVPVYRSFGRWFVACDNTRACEARGFGEVARSDLRVTRAAGTSAPTVTLSAADVPLDGTTIRLDGASFPLPPPAWGHGGGGADAPPQLSTSDPAAVRAFIAAVRNGHLLQLSDADDDSVPLDGFTAALLFVDAVQGRPGTPHPLVAASGAGEPLAPLPLPTPPSWRSPPSLGAGEVRSLRARASALPQPRDEPCRSNEATDMYPLDESRAIVLRPCNLFAYQGSSLVYVLPRRQVGPPVPVALPLPGLPDRGSASTGPEMVEPSFDPATGQLSFAAKGRGLADCGESASWVWHAGAFRLLSLSFEDQCGGSEPGDWPTLYRTAAKP